MSPDSEAVDIVAVLWRRKWLIVLAVLCSTLGAYLFSAYRITPLYQAAAKIIVRQESLDPDQDFSGYGYGGAFMYNQRELLHSLPMIAAAREQALRDVADILSKDDAPSAGELQRGLTLEVVRDTSVLSFACVSSEKKFVAPFLHALIRVFRDDYNRNKQDAVSRSLAAVAGEIAAVEQRLQHAERDLEEYLLEHNIGLLPEGEVAMSFARYGTYEFTLAELSAELERAKTDLVLLLEHSEPDSDEAPLLFLVNSPVLMDLYNKSRLEEIRKAELLTRYAADHPDVVIATNTVAYLREAVRREQQRLLAAEKLERQAAIRVAERKLEILEAKAAERKAEAERVVASQPKLSALMYQLKLWRARHSDLLGKERHLRIFRERMDESDIIVLEPPLESAEPVSPNMVKNSVAGAILGLLVGIALAAAMRDENRVGGADKARAGGDRKDYAPIRPEGSLN